MKTVLMTAFEPFGGERINPSWEAVRSFDGREFGGARIVVRQLPVVFARCGQVLTAALEELQPHRVLCVGQAGGRSDISVERVAINVNDARIPDNDQQQPVDQPIVAGNRRPISLRCRSKRWSRHCAKWVFRLRCRKPPGRLPVITSCITCCTGCRPQAAQHAAVSCISRICRSRRRSILVHRVCRPPV